MNDLTPNEENFMEMLEENDYNNLTEDNVGQFTSILERLDPEVAKSIIEKLPDTVRGMAEITRIYTDLLGKGIDSCAEGATSCYASEDRITEALAAELGKDIPFEQKQYYVEKMEASAKRKEAKDTEHRATVKQGWLFAGSLIGSGLLILAGIFLGGGASGGKLPPIKPR